MRNSTVEQRMSAPVDGILKDEPTVSTNTQPATVGNDNPWHAQPLEQILSNPGVAKTGLSTTEAAAWLERYGPNRLIETPPVSSLTLLLREFRSVLVLSLLAAALLLFAVGAVDSESSQYVDATLILLIVFFNGGLGFVQNFRAQRGIEALKD